MHRAVWNALALFACLALTACGDNSPQGEEANSPGNGKADSVGNPNLAPAWLLSVDASGTWIDADEDDENPVVIRGWVDVKLQNRRFHKRVFVEMAAPYPSGLVMRTLHPARHKGSAGGNDELWGVDTIEFYPEGGPHGAVLSGPVMVRGRMQDDLDEDGQDEVVVTPWSVLYGTGSPWQPAVDPWYSGWTSPAVDTGDTAVPQVYYTPFDDAGAAVVDLIGEVIAAKLADPTGRHTIHGAVFNINDPRITDALIDAHYLGVEVRLLTDAGKLSPAAYWQAEDDRLLAAGVPLLGVRREGNGAMHDKFAIFDGQVLTTGSFNWEWGSSHENHENMLVTANPDLLKAYAARFQAMAGQNQFARASANDPWANVSVSFAPDEEPHRIMGQLMDQAKETIHVCMFTCKDVEYQENGQTTSLFAKMGDAVRRGVDVRVVTDFGVSEASEYYGTISEDDPMDEYLESLGVHVVRADNTFGPYASMHHKFSIIDDEIAVTGAMNWYYDAAYLNDEDQLVWRDSTLAANYHGEFVEMLRRYDASYDASEWPAVDVEFAVHNDMTNMGDTVYLTGTIEELGDWDPTQGIALDPTDWPLWKATLPLPAGIRVEYKFVTVHSDGATTWQDGWNHTARVPTDVQSVTLDHWF